MSEDPSRPSPRERFSVHPSDGRSEYEVGIAQAMDVHDADGTVVASYVQTYGPLTFEPFRQGERFFALVRTDPSPPELSISVLDLQSGMEIAAVAPPLLIPFGYYVPDLNDRRFTTKDPDGRFGFVWGPLHGQCDGARSVQFLDLSRVQQGELRLDDRFPDVRLATHPELKPWDFIRCDENMQRVEFDVEETYDLATGSFVPVVDL